MLFLIFCSVNYVIFCSICAVFTCAAQSFHGGGALVKNKTQKRVWIRQGCIAQPVQIRNDVEKLLMAG
jgi:hypothetical protein